MRSIVCFICLGMAPIAGCDADAGSRTSDSTDSQSGGSNGAETTESDPSDPCGEPPCPLDAGGHMTLDCLCELIDCPLNPESALKPDSLTVVSTYSCGDQTVIGWSSSYHAEAFGYRDGDLSSAYVYDHGDGFSCLWHSTADFPSLETCTDRCIVSYRDVLAAPPGECLDDDEFTEHLGMGGWLLVR